MLPFSSFSLKISIMFLLKFTQVVAKEMKGIVISLVFTHTNIIGKDKAYKI